MATTKQRAPRKKSATKREATAATKEAAQKETATAKKEVNAAKKQPRSLAPEQTTPTALVRRAASPASVAPVAPLTLVTGGTGFLGSQLVRQLVETDRTRVRVLSTSQPDWLAALGVESLAGSITSAEDVARAVEGVSEIYHLAGRGSRETEDARQMYALHVDGTRLLCDAAREAGVKSIVLASTSGTIAVTKEPDIVPDEDWPTPLDIVTRWPYYASKVYQERVALEHFSGEGRRLVLVNPSLLLGPGDERLSSTSIILDFLARKIISTPKGGLSFVDVRDAATAFRAAMGRGRHGERYLLGTVNWTFEKFFGRLARLTNTAAPRVKLPSALALPAARGLHALYRQWKLAPPVEPTEIEMADYFWYVNSAKAARELNFLPRDPAETLQDTISYVRRNFLNGHK